MIVKTKESFLLKDTMRDLKKFTSKKVIDLIKNEPESRREWILELLEKEAQPSKKA